MRCWTRLRAQARLGSHSRQRTRGRFGYGAVLLFRLRHDPECVTRQGPLQGERSCCLPLAGGMFDGMAIDEYPDERDAAGRLSGNQFGPHRHSISRAA